MEATTLRWGRGAAAALLFIMVAWELRADNEPQVKFKVERYLASDGQWYDYVWKRVPPGHVYQRVKVDCAPYLASDGKRYSYKYESRFVKVAASDRSPYAADLAILTKTWPKGPRATKIEDFFTVVLKMPDRSIPAPTHVFGPVNIIPYDDGRDGVRDAAGALVGRGDAEIAKAFPPGAIGFAIKHHRPEHRELDAENPNDKEHLKLQDTHISTVVGVVRDGQAGAITVNNPQNYERGGFGNVGYSMIFVRPTYPKYLSPAQQAAFQDNIRTMLIGFNAVSQFPGDYNGGDPLAAHTVEKLRLHVDMMVRAIAGDAAGQQFFKEPANMMYCAELAFVSASAGVVVPLNAKTLVPRVGKDTWQAFAREVKSHNAGETSTFAALNKNESVRLVKLALAPEELYPIASYAPSAAERDEDGKRLAQRPMTMSDIIEHFLRNHVPREQIGEQVAPIQAAILRAMKPGLLEQLAMDNLEPSDPPRKAVESLFEKIVATVARPHASYNEFRRQLEPLQREASQIGGPLDPGGQGLYTPPSLFHVVAQDKHPGGVLGLEYVGHGIHFSAVKKAAR